MTAISHHPKRKDLMIEARFLPASIDQAKQLRTVIRERIEQGDVADISPAHAESVADAITGWLIGKTDGVDGLSAPTRSRYRKVLAALEELTPAPDGERGHVHRPGIAGVLAASTALAGAGLAAGSPALMALAAVAYIAGNLRYVDHRPQVGPAFGSRCSAAAGRALSRSQPSAVRTSAAVGVPARSPSTSSMAACSRYKASCSSSSRRRSTITSSSPSPWAAAKRRAMWACWRQPARQNWRGLPVRAGSGSTLPHHRHRSVSRRFVT